MRTHFSFYDKTTGEIKPLSFRAPNDAHVQANTPPNCEVIEGRFDHLSQRVDLDSGEVVDYIPPQPSDDHEWNNETKRWVLSAKAQLAVSKDRQARAEIERLEQQSMRSIREQALGDESAKARIEAIDAQIVELRKDVISPARSR